MRSISGGAYDLIGAPLAVEDAGAWDILFLVSEIAAGASGGHFNARSVTSGGQRTLAILFAKALLSRRWPFSRYLAPAFFLAARSRGGTVGAAVASLTQVGDGKQVLTLDFVVVDKRFREHGIANALVHAMLDQAPAGAQVHCWCTQSSRAMQRLVSRLGFTRAQGLVYESDVCGERMRMPTLWVKQM